MFKQVVTLITLLALSTPAMAGETEYSEATQRRIEETLARTRAPPMEPILPITSAEFDDAMKRYKSQRSLGSVIMLGGSALVITAVVVHRDVDLQDPSMEDSRTTFAVMIGAGAGLVVAGLVVFAASKKPSAFEHLTWSPAGLRVRF